MAHACGCGNRSCKNWQMRPGITISVCRFPPGTSKWNKIEHRLFPFISSNWVLPGIRGWIRCGRDRVGPEVFRPVAFPPRIDEAASKTLSGRFSSARASDHGGRSAVPCPGNRPRHGGGRSVFSGFSGGGTRGKCRVRTVFPAGHPPGCPSILLPNPPFPA